MNGYSVVPKRGCVRTPMETDLYVHVIFVHVIEMIEDKVALALIEPHNAIRDGSVNEEAFPARDWMHPNKRMDPFEVLRTSRLVTSLQLLVSHDKHEVCYIASITSMDSKFTINEFSEFRGEFLVSGISTGP